MGFTLEIGGLTYGLGVRYLGMSLGNSVVLGFCAAFGAVVPSIYYSIYPATGKVSFLDMIANPGGQLVLLGVVVCLTGIAISGKAGMMKEKELSKEQQAAKCCRIQPYKRTNYCCNFGYSELIFQFWN